MLESILDGLTWLGHDAFRLRAAGKVIYFDPFRLAAGQSQADLILVSHEHFDHCSPEDIAMIQGAKTVIVTEPVSAGKLRGDVRIMAPGGRLDLGGVIVEAVPAYNLDKKFHPRQNNWLGFVLTIDGVRIYHAGDTDRIPEMKTLKADIALLPVSGTYVMTADEAALAALDISPRVAVPMHFATIVGTGDDARRFAAALKGRVEVRIPATD